MREYGRRWYQKNKRRRYEKGRAWVERNRQRYSELQRRWYQVNRDAHKRGVQLRRRRRPEMMAVYVANGKARKMGCQGRLKVSDWIAVKERYGHRCLCCGAHESQVKLTIDHIVPLSKGGQNTIDNIQPLCIRCNCKKWTQVIDYRSGHGKAAEGA